MSIASVSIKHLARQALLAVVVVAFLTLGLYAYLDYSMSLAVVRGGVMPGQAMSDLEAFQNLSSLTTEGPSLSNLKLAGRVFVVTPDTQCRVVRRFWSTACQGDNHLFQIKLLDGARSGQTVLMCSDTIRMLYPWP